MKLLRRKTKTKHAAKEHARQGALGKPSSRVSKGKSEVADEVMVELPASTALLYDYIRSPLMKRLLNQVVASQEEQQFKSVTVLSELAGEGKTLLIAALALGYSALLRKRVLIIDTVSKDRSSSLFATVLQPALSKGHLLEAMNGTQQTWAGGTVDLVTMSSERHKVYVQHTENVAGLPPQALAPVPYKPSQLYETAEFHLGNLVTALGPSYDLILVDTCALSTVSSSSFDPVIMAKQADCSILVTTKQTLGREAVARIKSHVQQQSIRIIGAVYNRPQK